MDLVIGAENFLSWWLQNKCKSLSEQIQVIIGTNPSHYRMNVETFRRGGNLIMQSADYWAKEHLPLAIRTWVPGSSIELFTWTIMPFLSLKTKSMLYISPRIDSSLFVWFPSYHQRSRAVQLKTIYLTRIDGKLMFGVWDQSSWAVLDLLLKNYIQLNSKYFAQDWLQFDVWARSHCQKNCDALQVQWKPSSINLPLKCNLNNIILAKIWLGNS